MRWFVGQEVVTDRRTVCAVIKVTPAGRVTIASGDQFTPDGRKWGCPQSNWRPAPRIEPMTEDIRDEVSRRDRSIAADDSIRKSAEFLKGVRSLKWETPYRATVPSETDLQAAEELAAGLTELIEAYKAKMEKAR